MPILHVSENELPKNYKNKIIENNEKHIVIRCNLLNIDDINKWVTEFGELTHTKWNSRATRPKGMRFICWKHFVCHRSSFNKGTRSKDENCEANLKVKIKINNAHTRYNDPYLKLGLSAVISIRKLHSHSLKTREALRLLPPGEAVKAKFRMYFENGMGIAESCKYHRRLLEVLEKSELELSNGRINPTERTVRHWHDSWKQSRAEIGKGIDLVQKLKEMQTAYADLGITMQFDETEFSLAIVTPLMKRTHELKSSQNIVFIDTTSAHDAEDHCVTLVLTSCPAGVSPLGVIVTKGQSYESYQAGFKLLNAAVENSFGGQGFPNIFITDNSQDKIDAIKSVWPNSINLYSFFYVCHNVWQWLSDLKNCIPEEEVLSLMLAFQRILSSSTVEEATDAFQNLYYSTMPYPNFQKYIEDYWEYKELWCLAWRDGSYGEHLANHFSELCIHIFRDIVLSRVKINKVITLVDFCCTVLEDYYCNKFRQFANIETSSIKIFFNSLLKQTTYVDTKDIVCNGEEFYVPSEDKSEVYVVVTEFALCSCLAGRIGKVCEHLCAVYKGFDVVFEKFPPLTVEDRYTSTVLAMGDEILLKPFYYFPTLSENTDTLYVPENNSVNFVSISDESMTSLETNEETFINGEGYEGGIDELLERMKACHSKFGSTQIAVKQIIQNLQEIKSANQWEAFLHMLGSEIPP